MNKEQQIKELQNDIIDNLFDGGTYGLAEALYNAGYRKVPKGLFICSGSEANLGVEVCNNCGMQQADDEKRRLLKEHEDENRRQKDASKTT